MVQRIDIANTHLFFVIASVGWLAIWEKFVFLQIFCLTNVTDPPVLPVALEQIPFVSWVDLFFLVYIRQYVFLFFDSLELTELQLILADINDIQIVLAFVHYSWHRRVVTNFILIVWIAVLHLLYALSLLYAHKQIVILR